MHDVQDLLHPPRRSHHLDARTNTARVLAASGTSPSLFSAPGYGLKDREGARRELQEEILVKRGYSAHGEGSEPVKCACPICYSLADSASLRSRTTALPYVFRFVTAASKPMSAGGETDADRAPSIAAGTDGRPSKISSYTTGLTLLSFTRLRAVSAGPGKRRDARKDLLPDDGEALRLELCTYVNGHPQTGVGTDSRMRPSARP